MLPNSALWNKQFNIGNDRSETDNYYCRNQIFDAAFKSEKETNIFRDSVLEHSISLDWRVGLIL